MRILAKIASTVLTFVLSTQLSAITQTEASNLVLQQIVPNTGSNVYLANGVRAGGQELNLPTQKIPLPYSLQYVFFVDEVPGAAWNHASKCIFVDQVSGQYQVVSSNTCPSDLNNYLSIREYKPVAAPTLPQDPNIKDFVPTTKNPNSHLYAVLINSTTGNRNNRYFKNNLCSWFAAMVENYGYQKENIYIHSTDGTVANNWNDIDFDNDNSPEKIYAATRKSVFITLKKLSEKMTKDDQLIIITTGHGGQFVNFSQDSYIWGSEIYNTIPTGHDNENSFGYQPITEGFTQYPDPEDPNMVISTSDLKSWLEPIKNAQTVMFMSQPMSGGFALGNNNLSGNHRYIYTATGNTEADGDITFAEQWINQSDMVSQGYSEFYYYLTAPFRGFYPANNNPFTYRFGIGSLPFKSVQSVDPLGSGTIYGTLADHPDDYNPDINQDGIIAIDEAVNYATNNNSFTTNGYYQPWKGILKHGPFPQDPTIYYFYEDYTGKKEVPQLSKNTGLPSNLLTLSGFCGTLSSSFSLTNGNYVIYPQNYLNISSNSTLSIVRNVDKVNAGLKVFDGGKLNLQNNAKTTVGVYCDLYLGAGETATFGSNSEILVDAGTLTLESTVLANGKITVNSSSTLRIKGNVVLNGTIIDVKAGAIIEMDENASISANNMANIQMLGTSVLPITIKNSILGTTWNGLLSDGSGTLNISYSNITKASTAVNNFANVTIKNCHFSDCNTGINLPSVKSAEISASIFNNCYNGISLRNRDETINCPIAIKNNQLTGINAFQGTTGIYLFSSGLKQSVISNNTVSYYNTGFNLSYGNSVIKSNIVKNCNSGISIFESSPILSQNMVVNNAYGITVMGYAAPILNPFLSNDPSIPSGGYNRIANNTYYQLYYSLNSKILLTSGKNDIYASSTAYPLVIKATSAQITKAANVTNNYWGSGFNPALPANYFNPANGFTFTPYNTTPNTTNIEIEIEIPDIEQLNVFDKGLKNEIDGNNSAASAIYTDLLTTDPDNADAILPRLEYTRAESGKSSVLDNLHSDSTITDFTYYSALAQNAYNNSNKEVAADNYLLKMDNSVNHTDSLITKINLLDLIWNDGSKAGSKAANKYKELVCKNENEYTAKRDFLMDELLGGKVGVANSENSITDFVLQQNYPNPFNPTTVISYALPEQGNVKIMVYNMAGAVVAEFNQGMKNRGQHQITFDGTNYSAGMYVYMLEYNGKPMMTKKMVMLK